MGYQLHNLAIGVRSVVDEHTSLACGRNVASVGAYSGTMGCGGGVGAKNDPGQRSVGARHGGARMAFATSQGHALARQHSGLDKRIYYGAEARKMLAIEDEHGIVERMHIAHGVFFSAFTFVVNHVHWQIPVVEAGLHYAIRQVNVFAIHEEIFVEAANVLQQICAAKHVSSRQNVNLARLKLRQEAQMIFGKQFFSG